MVSGFETKCTADDDDNKIMMIDVDNGWIHFPRQKATVVSLHFQLTVERERERSLLWKMKSDYKIRNPWIHSPRQKATVVPLHFQLNVERERERVKVSS
jgi:hypothetical protein